MAKKANKELSVEEKLQALYNLQLVDSEIDKIEILRGELPLEVQDLEDEIAGLETRITKQQAALEELVANLKGKHIEIEEAQMLIAKYEEQQNNVRNNREFDALSKEIEFQKLEIELCEKRIREYSNEIKNKEESIATSTEFIEDRKKDLELKKVELDEITSETQKEEANLRAKSEKIMETIEERLVTAYKRIRGNARNGLAVATVERDSCRGCFNKIPPQRQLDIRMRNKITVCEYCGRILVDKDIETPLVVLEKQLAEEMAKKEEAKLKKTKRKTTRAKKAAK